MTNEIVKINPSDYGLDETKAQEITKGLKTILAEREVLIEQYKECILLEITQESIPRFKELRLLIRDNRTKGIEPWHKANKSFFLAGGNFVDAIKRKEVTENERMEEKLLEGEKFFENQEHERTEKLRVDRLALIKPYTEIEPLALGHMEQPVFDNLLQGFKVAYETRIAAEKKTEEDRIAKEKADAEEREAQRLENIRLKAEAEEKERLAEIERKKNAKILANLKAKADKEREEKERLEVEIKAKKDAEIEVERKRKADEKKFRLAPDKDKLLSFMQLINDLPRPQVKSIEAADIASKVNTMLVQTSNYIKEYANKL